MVFRQRLPSIRTLRQLAEIDGPFPAKNRHAMLAAERFWFGENVIAFLKLFPPNEVFHSRDDFIDRCKELEYLILEERRAPVEKLPSPQG